MTSTQTYGYVLVRLVNNTRAARHIRLKPETYISHPSTRAEIYVKHVTKDTCKFVNIP